MKLKNKFSFYGLLASIILFFIKDSIEAKFLLTLSFFIFSFMFYKLNIANINDKK